MTTWHSDSCDCIIEFDDNVIEANGRNKVIQIHNKCPAHSTVDIFDDKDLYDVALGDNQRKNVLHGKIMEQFPSLVDDKGDKGKSLKEGINYKFNYTGTGKNRILEVELEGANLNAADKKKIKDTADTTFGNGKVSVK